MDGVACVCVNDPDRGTLPVDKYCELVKWTYDSYGLEIAVGFAVDIHSSVFTREALRSGGPEYMCDTLESGIYSFYYRGELQFMQHPGYLELIAALRR